ncbi:TRAP transporter small permease [Nocardioides sp. W7]|uniref:TRAP transporter small permease n=1 Tax=Nocardioides sp. W7 TaxID=2931390 RepID=UPI001FD610D5|nr:TRAP transporter small permease [Nocardioides sp. W7]
MTADTPTGNRVVRRVAAVFTDPPRWLARTVRVVTAVEIAIASAALLLIFFLVLVQAGQRYLPIDGWPWTGELARFSLVWLTFLSAGVLVTSDSHIAIEMVDGFGGPRLRRVVRVLSCLIVAAVGYGLTLEALELVDTQSILKSPALGMPMSWLYGISLIGFVSTTIRALVAAVQYAVLGAPELSYDDVVGVPTA